MPWPRGNQLWIIGGSVACVTLVVGAVAILPTVFRDDQSSQDPSQQPTTPAPTLDPAEIPDPSELDEAACERVTHPTDGEDLNGIKTMSPSGEYILADDAIFHDGDKTEFDRASPNSVNSSGVAVANYSPQDGEIVRPFRLEDGEATALELPSGISEENSVSATTINDNGDITGAITSSRHQHQIVPLLWPAGSTSPIELSDTEFTDSDANQRNGNHVLDIRDDKTVLGQVGSNLALWHGEDHEQVTLPLGPHDNLESADLVGDWIGVFVEDLSIGIRVPASDTTDYELFNMDKPQEIDAHGRGYGIIDKTPVRQDGDTLEALPLTSDDKTRFHYNEDIAYEEPKVTISAVSHDGKTISGGLIDPGDEYNMVHNIMWHCD